MDAADWKKVSQIINQSVYDLLMTPTIEFYQTVKNEQEFSYKCIKNSLRNWKRNNYPSYIISQSGDEIHIHRPKETTLYIGQLKSGCSVEFTNQYTYYGRQFKQALIIEDIYCQSSHRYVTAVLHQAIYPSDIPYWKQLSKEQKDAYKCIYNQSIQTIAQSLIPRLTSVSDRVPATQSTSIETYAELCETIYQIASQHYVKGLYPSSSGDIGTTFETLLNIDANNIQESDLEFAELKTQHQSSTAKKTLFSKTPKPSNQVLWNSTLLEKCGYTDSKGRQALKSTVKQTEPNTHRLFLNQNHQSKQLEVKHTQYGYCFGWDFTKLQEILNKKLNGLMLIQANKKTHNSDNFFWYNQADYFSGINLEKFKEMIQNGIISVDIRLHKKPTGQIRDRGTAFRIQSLTNMKQMYQTHREILTTDDANELAKSELTHSNCPSEQT